MLKPNTNDKETENSPQVKRSNRNLFARNKRSSVGLVNEDNEIRLNNLALREKEE